MKKMLFVCLLMLIINVFSFSLEESWLSTGAGFGNYIEKDKALGDFYMGAFGINLSGYGFWNKKNIGIFYNYGFLFPSVNNIENNFDPILQFDFLWGVGFRHHISEKLKLHYGIGFNVFFSSFMDRIDRDHKTTDYRIGLGIGGDIGIKYDITDVVYVDFGTSLSYNFASYRNVKSTNDNWTNTKQEASGWINNFSMIGIKPYIAVGFNVYEESNGKWGKPE